MTGQQLPIARFKAGQVSSAIWQNEVQMPRGAVKILKATVQRRYKDKNSEWQSSGSFNRNEIPLAIHCLRKAFEKIIDLQRIRTMIRQNRLSDREAEFYEKVD